VPGFVEWRKQDDPAREGDGTVPAASGQFNLVLPWVAEE
jgi:hypothetical protein